MTGKQLKRFEKWRTRLPARTAYFVQLVLDDVVPLFEAHGFQRHADYAGDSGYAVAHCTIGLQRRAGDAWPTVEISFDKRCRPFLCVNFALLPETCYRLGPDSDRDIPRIAASVVEGDVFYMLCKEQGFIINTFGCGRFSLMPKRRMRTELDQLKALLPFLMQLFDEGIPPAWAGRLLRVHPNVSANRGARQLARPPAMPSPSAAARQE